MPASLLLVAALVLLAGCGEPPRSFHEATLEQANALLADPDIAVVEALDARAAGFGAIARGVRWRLDDATRRRQPVVRPGAVLVLASSRAAGFRSAAELSRSDHQPIWVFVPKDESERRALVIPAVEAKEEVREQGS
jgi:hypothetical protein